MSTSSKGSPGKTLLIVVVGLIMAVGGYWLSVNWHSEFIENLNHQGIPIDIGKTVSMIGMFLFLFPALNYFYFRPLSEAIGTRTSELEQTFAEAEELRATMNRMRTEYDERLRETENNAREQIQAQIREAQTLRTTLMAEASTRADEMILRAEQEIEAEKQKALTEIRMHVVDLTMTAAERVLGENMNNDRNRRLVSEFIDKVEVPA
ncbi:MAG TPA: F0F1 ATP synthase subunit B [Fimbriimonas sp.]|nr:F0F1 ATP synthase subunit B [Fimbriimonas sp.]